MLVAGALTQVIHRTLAATILLNIIAVECRIRHTETGAQAATLDNVPTGRTPLHQVRRTAASVFLAPKATTVTSTRFIPMLTALGRHALYPNKIRAPQVAMCVHTPQLCSLGASSPFLALLDRTTTAPGKRIPLLAGFVPPVPSVLLGLPIHCGLTLATLKTLMENQLLLVSPFTDRMT